jgi:hypothetical protein
LDIAVVRRHLPNVVCILNSVFDFRNDAQQSYDQDANSIVDVVLYEPQEDAEILKQIEWR